VNVLLYDAKFTDAMPEILAEEPWLQCLAEVVREEIRGILDKESFCSIYNNLDDMPEWVLDAIAPNIRCEFYRETDDIETKRDNIRQALWGNNIKGTVAATEMLAFAVFGQAKTEVQEWFNYGDDPGYFQIVLRQWGVVDAQLDDFIVRMDGYKRLSIWLRRFLILIGPPAQQLRFGAAMMRARRTVMFRMPGLEATARIGMVQCKKSSYFCDYTYVGRNTA